MKNRKAWLGLGAVVVVAAILFTVYWAFAPQGKEGAKTITVEVFNGEEFVGNHTLTTDKAYLGDALKEAGLVEGEESATGLFVKTVDGITADDSQQQWWCFTKGGKDLNTGVDATPVEDGDCFEATLKTGW